ncbi:MAG TPA: hypothetical protein DEF03_04905 [Bacteroidetes bacterium]|nr:MAG: hypothetical protein CBD88_01325 [Flavobacteriales bacterium TMED228]HBW00514.1 hypothetical protein [Bacteroidota bacterium]
MSTERMRSFLSTINQSNRFVCPECSSERKNKTDKSLSVTVDQDGVLYKCHHCEISGKHTHETLRNLNKPKVSQPVAISVPKINNVSQLEEYLLSRHIDYKQIKDRFKIVSGDKYFAAKGDIKSATVPAVGFVYGENEAVKWRSIGDKRFTQDGAARQLWGIDRIRDQETLPKTLIITEGEIDAASVAQVVPSTTGVCSVPNGAPSKVSQNKVTAEEDTKFHYLWTAKDVLGGVDEIILATDNDAAGQALKEEVARRSGRAKCKEISFPPDCKDLNEILVTHGGEALSEVIINATHMPLEGVYQAEEYFDSVKELYDQGLVTGFSTGIASLDELYTISPGQLSIITGTPGSGKSEFIDQIMVNLARNHHWKCAIASFENPVPLHLAKLSEKVIKRPFFKNKHEPRMTEIESEKALDFIQEHFMFLEQRSGDSTTIESVLDRLQQAILRLGVRFCVIDPYNYIVRDQHQDEHEHQFINKMLTRLVSFARSHDVHIALVAHPAKMQTDSQGKTAVPTGHNISGSHAFFSKADFGITVHRESDGPTIHVWKCRFKWMGKLGELPLKYNVNTGVFEDHRYEFEEADIEF